MGKWLERYRKLVASERRITLEYGGKRASSPSSAHPDPGPTPPPDDADDAHEGQIPPNSSEPGPSLAQRPPSSTTEADKATTAKAFGSLAFTCSGCGQAVTQLHKAGDHWQCSHCAGVDAIALPPVAAPLNPCRLCGVNSWWRSGPAEAWVCRRCHPPASLRVYEVLGPYGKPGDAVRTQPRADVTAWEAAWCELGPITDGITEDDSRVQPILAAVEQCRTAYRAGDWPAFHQAVAQVRLAVQMEHER